MSFDLLLISNRGGYFYRPVVIDHDGDGVDRRDAPCEELEILDPGASIPVDLDA